MKFKVIIKSEFEYEADTVVEVAEKVESMLLDDVYQNAITIIERLDDDKEDK